MCFLKQFRGEIQPFSHKYSNYVVYVALEQVVFYF